MIAELIRLLLAATCALFVLSLPLWKTQAGAALRRAAGVCFVLAFLPSLVVGLFGQPSSADGASAGAGALHGLGCLAAVLLLSIIAYGVLKLRARLRAKAKPRDPWEAFFGRGGGKRPFYMGAPRGGNRGPFSFPDDEEEP